MTHLIGHTSAAIPSSASGTRLSLSTGPGTLMNASDKPSTPSSKSDSKTCPSEPLVRCPDCLSPDVHALLWVHGNTKAVVPGEDPERYYCPHCDETYDYLVTGVDGR